MRTSFIPHDLRNSVFEHDTKTNTCLSRQTAHKLCPFAAAVITRADGGWLCFESYDDYRTWRKQI